MRPTAVLHRIAVGAALAVAAPLSAQSPRPPLPPLPDSTGWGVHVLAAARDPRGAIWVGTYGHGIFRLRPGATAWERIRHDTTASSISWDFVQAFGFGPRGEIWYGTLGNGWGLSTDGGQTWRNWTFSQLGPEWQYVAPGGIVVRGDTTAVGTADGIQMTTANGERWTAMVDRAGPAAKGPADTAIVLLANEYVKRLGADRRGWVVATARGNQRLRNDGARWHADSVGAIPFTPANGVLVGRVAYRGTPCGLRRATDTLPCLRRAQRAAGAPQAPRTTWFRRPVDRADNWYIDQTYRYGSTMGGNFQQHQGIEFNNADGTPVRAIGAGTVVFAGPAEAGALTVAIRHDSVVNQGGQRHRIYSVYYHNAALGVRVGERVEQGEVISRVGNTGRATNDHLHLEVHAAPTDSVAAIVDSLERYPRYTTNPELWIEPIPGTGIIAGQVLDSAGAAVPQARIYGIIKSEPAETPFSFAETYGDKAHPHPLYGEHFAVGDVPAGTYVLGTEVGGRKLFRRVTVEPGKLTWVVFK